MCSGMGSGVDNTGLIEPDPPEAERPRILGMSYSSIDMDLSLGGRLTLCMGIDDTAQ